MKLNPTPQASRFLGLAFTLIAVHFTAAADFITNDPNLPPDGVYLDATQVHAMYSGPNLAVVLKDAVHAPIAAEVQRRNIGADEEETFQTTLTGLGDVTAGAQVFTDLPINNGG